MSEKIKYRILSLVCIFLGYPLAGGIIFSMCDFLDRMDSRALHWMREASSFVKGMIVPFGLIGILLFCAILVAGIFLPGVFATAAWQTSNDVKEMESEEERLQREISARLNRLLKLRR